jgi:rhamnosyltransferase subunit A
MKARFESRTFVIETPGGYCVQVEKIIRGHSPAAKSVLFVNGALASSRSFRWALAGLPNHNLIFYDLPHIGASKPFNRDTKIITPNTEVAILRHLIDRYAPNHLASMSWGGFAALLSLAEGPASVEKALIGSFSNRITDEMRVLLLQLDHLMAHRRYDECAQLVNETLGKHLPKGLKRLNFAHLMSMGEDEREYILLHIKRMLQYDTLRISFDIKNIRAELLFINGERDVYTAWSHVNEFARSQARSRTVVIPEAGHFLTAENPASARKIARLANSFFETASLGDQLSGDTTGVTGAAATP